MSVHPGQDWPRLAVQYGPMGATGDQIKRERLRRKLSREGLAQRTGVSAKTISRIENGERVSDLSFIVEEYLGLAEIDQEQPDNRRLLREVPEPEFWAEAARRAYLNAETADLPRGPRYDGRDAPYPDHLDAPQADKRRESGA